MLLVQKILTEYLASQRNQLSSQLQTAYSQSISLFIQNLATTTRRAPTINDLTMDNAIGFLRYLSSNRSVETEHLYTRGFLHFLAWLQNKYSSPLTDKEVNKIRLFVSANRRPKKHSLPQIPTSAITHLIDLSISLQADNTTNRDNLRTLRDKAVILTLAHTGLKPSEISDLRCNNYDLHAKTITLPERPPLTINLRNNLNHAIHAYLNARSPIDKTQKHPADTPLFARHDKRVGSRLLPISRWTIANIINNLVATLPPEHQRDTVSALTFRHYFVLESLSQTSGDLALAKSLARHKDIATTRLYQKLASITE